MTTIAKQILDGTLDAELDAIRDAIRERQNITRTIDTAKAMTEIQVGDTVILKDLSPKYVNGTKVKVHAKKRTKIVVKFETPVGRFTGLVNVPASCVDKA